MVNIRVNILNRIICLATRAFFKNGKVTIVAVNLNYMVYKFHYDSTHGKFKSTVKSESRELIINEKAITTFHEQDPTEIKCGDDGAKYVVESTCVYYGECCRPLEG